MPNPDAPSAPESEPATEGATGCLNGAPEILITGATGYIGGRLRRRLEDQGLPLRCLARRPKGLAGRAAASTEVLPGDVLDLDSLRAPLTGIRTAYYLIHSMGVDEGFRDLDRRGALNFATAAADAGVERIIYLGGLAHGPGLSEHLQSRIEVGELLASTGVEVIELRASIVIGSASLSFELVRSLVRRLPVMITPRWVEVEAQPIAVADVLAYLDESRSLSLPAPGAGQAGGPARPTSAPPSSPGKPKVAQAGAPSAGSPPMGKAQLPAARKRDHERQPADVEQASRAVRAAPGSPSEGPADRRASHHHIYEIGGPARVTYGELMREYARQRGVKRWMIRVPFLTPRLSSLWLGLVTPLYARVGRKLVESIKHPTVVQDPRALEAFSVEPMDMPTAVAEASRDEDRTFAESTWYDALSSGGAPRTWAGVQFHNRLIDSRTTEVAVEPERAFAPIANIGGRTGWYAFDWLWKLRGLLDLIVGGVGVRRGRPPVGELAVGDALDFWRVEAIEPGHLLRLSAEMKLPGRAWLEFKVEPVETSDGPPRSCIRQTALFDPVGLMGLSYWYLVYPLHGLVFAAMIKNIARAAEEPPVQAAHASN